MRKLVLVAAAAALAIPASALAAGEGPTATAAKSRPGVSLTRAQGNAKTRARVVFKKFNNAVSYGNGLNANCTRKRSYELICKGYVTFVSSTGTQFDCFFPVKTVGLGYTSSGKARYTYYYYPNREPNKACES